MSLAPLLDAPIVIQLHVIAALCAVALGPFKLLRRSRDFWHRGLGYAWVIAMAITALSSFGIASEFGSGPISPIHALSVFTIWGLCKGVNAARKHHIAAHQNEMRGLYFWAIGVAGLFTFLPERRMNTVMFGEPSTPGFFFMSSLIGAGLAWYVYTSRRAHART